MKTYKKDKKAFLQVKSALDGQVFWREVEGDKVEIRKVCGSSAIREIIESLPDGDKPEVKEEVTETPQ
jgi:hypothetical protein